MERDSDFMEGSVPASQAHDIALKPRGVEYYWSQIKKIMDDAAREGIVSAVVMGEYDPVQAQTITCWGTRGGIFADVLINRLRTLACVEEGVE